MRNERKKIKRVHLLTTWVAVAVAVFCVGIFADATAGDQAAVKPTERIGVEATFVRVAETDVGWVVLGYQTANESVGDEWMLLNVGMTVMPGQKGQKITRDQIKLVTPDHKVISLPTQEEYSNARAKLTATTRRDDMMHQSIDYFPSGANLPCRIGFFADPTQPMQSLAYDQVELSPQRACVGRLYFHVPGGIKLGNYNLDVEFAGSVVRVPMRIMTKDEAKEFEKKWKESLKKDKH